MTPPWTPLQVPILLVKLFIVYTFTMYLRLKEGKGIGPGDKPLFALDKGEARALRQGTKDKGTGKK